MRTFVDKENDLLWVDYYNNAQKAGIFDYLKSKLGKGSNFTGRIPSEKETIAELDKWAESDNGKGIKDFVLISKKSNALGTYFYSKYIDPYRKVYAQHVDKNFYMYSAFRLDKNGNISSHKPVGTTLIVHDDYKDFPLKYRDTIEYLVVNPDSQHQGFGTAMTQSIMSNLPFFTNNPASNSLSLYVKDTNTPSIAICKKLGFKEFKRNDYYLLSGAESSYITFVMDNISETKYENQRSK